MTQQRLLAESENSHKLNIETWGRERDASNKEIGRLEKLLEESATKLNKMQSDYDITRHELVQMKEKCEQLKTEV